MDKKSNINLEGITMKKGDIYNGFLVLDVQEIPFLKATGIWCRHEKTKMEVFHLLNDDSENLFAYGFKTLPTNSKGAAHILEHSVLCGSKNYPLKDPFIRLSNQSVKTYLNALTFPDKTVYPGSSQVEKDYFNLMSVYGDAVFFPELKPEIFMQEAHHLEVDEKGEFSIQGVVFNEMKGSYSNYESVIFDELINNLLPNTPYAKDSGGNPLNIPELSYEELKAFHKKYYSPSNCKLFLAGNIPTEKQLDFISERFLNHLEAYDVDFPSNELEHFTSPKSIEVTGPYSKENKKNMVLLAWSTGSTNNPVDYMENLILQEVLIGHEGSPLAKAMLESKLGEDISPLCGFESTLKHLIFVAGLKGVKKSNVEKVEKMILSTLENLCKTGIPKKEVEIALMSIEFADREVKRANGPFSLALMRRCYRGWMNEKSPFEILQDREIFKQVKEKIQKDENYITELLRKRLVENNHRLLVNAYGSKKYDKEFEKSMKKTLNQAVKSTTIEKIKEEQEKLHAFQQTPDTEADLALLPHLKSSELDNKFDWVDLSQENIEDIPVYSNEDAVNGISYLRLWFPLDLLSPEDYKYLIFYSGVITSLGFAGKNWAEASSYVAETLGTLDAGPSTWSVEEKHLKKYNITSLDSKDDKQILYEKNPLLGRDWLTYRIKYLEEKTPEAIKLLFECIKTVSFDDKDRLKQLATEYHGEMLSSVIPGGSEIATLRAKTGFLHSATVSELFTGISQVYFAKEIAEMDINLLAAKLEAIHKTIISSGVVLNITGTDFGIKAAKTELKSYLSEFAPPKAPVFHNEKEFVAICQPQNSQNEPEWFDAKSVVGFAACACEIGDFDEKTTVAMNVVLRWFSNTLLWERIRTVGGAYGARAFLEDMDRILVFYSYRDPNPEKSLEEFENCIREMANHKFTQEETEKSVTGYYSLLISPKAPRGRGEIAFLRNLCEKTKLEKQAEMDHLLSITPEDLEKAAKILEKSCVNLQKTIIYNKNNKFAGKFDVLPL